MFLIAVSIQYSIFHLLNVSARNKQKKKKTKSAITRSELQFKLPKRRETTRQVHQLFNLSFKSFVIRCGYPSILVLLSLSLFFFLFLNTHTDTLVPRHFFWFSQLNPLGFLWWVRAQVFSTLETSASVS